MRSCFYMNPLNAEFNPICHLLAFLGAHPFLHVSRVRVNVELYKLYKSTLKCEGWRRIIKKII